MDSEYVICGNCGTKCNTNDKFCKVCFSTLPDTVIEPAIAGIEDVDIINYVEKIRITIWKNLHRKRRNGISSSIGRHCSLVQRGSFTGKCIKWRPYIPQR